MTRPQILEKEPVSLAEVKAMLAALKKRDTELTFRGNKTEEYVNQVCKLNKTKALELKKKLIALEVPRLKDEHVVKIVDVLPASIAELKVVIQGYSVTISNENLKKIQDEVSACLT